MAVKVAEVMALRRAFDVAAPVIEERWDIEQPDPGAPADPPPASLTERIAAKAAEVEGVVVGVESLPPSAAVQPTETPSEVAADTGDANGSAEPLTPYGAGGQDVPEDDPGPDAELPPVGATRADEDPLYRPAEGLTLDQFAERMKDADKGLVKRVAKGLYPKVVKFADLGPLDLLRVAENVEATPREEPVSPKRGPDEVATVANGGIGTCDDVSPLSGDLCTLDKEPPHTIHRHGLSESW
jgi:hypothetical protein